MWKSNEDTISSNKSLAILFDRSLTSPLRWGQTLCTEEQPKLISCLALQPEGGWALRLGTSRATWPADAWEHVSQRSQAVIRGECCAGSPVCILMADLPWGWPSNLSVELATHFLLVPRRNKSQVKSQRLTWRRKCRPAVYCCVFLCGLWNNSCSSFL